MTLRERFVNRIAEKHGHDVFAVNKAIETALEGRPFLEWLRSGGLAELIVLILNILELFAEKPE